MHIEFSGKIFIWRGPAPFYFVTVPADASQDIKAMSTFVTYGWGVIPVTVRLGKTEWKTSLFPKDGAYLVPLRLDVRKKERLDDGDTVTIQLDIGE